MTVYVHSVKCQSFMMLMKMWFSSTFQISTYCWKIFYNLMCMTYFNVKYVIGLFWGIRILSGVLRYVYMQIFVRLYTFFLSHIWWCRCLRGRRHTFSKLLHEFLFDLVFELFVHLLTILCSYPWDLSHDVTELFIMSKKKRQNWTKALILPSFSFFSIFTWWFMEIGL
jgi:hypothetical protein